MNKSGFSGLFVAEGSSDEPLAEIIESIFQLNGVGLHITKPDFSLLPGKVNKDLVSRLTAARQLMGHDVDVVIVHRDVDRVSVSKRLEEMELALTECEAQGYLLPVIPVRMTEAWLLLDEASIRQVAGNPRGQAPLNLPTPGEAERIADPKAKLREVIVAAANVTGRRHDRLVRRFDSNRRQLLERLDASGPVTALPSWRRMTRDIETVAGRLVEAVR